MSLALEGLKRELAVEKRVLAKMEKSDESASEIEMQRQLVHLLQDLILNLAHTYERGHH